MFVFELWLTKQEVIDAARLRNAVLLSDRTKLLSREAHIAVATGHSFHIFNLNDNLFIGVGAQCAGQSTVQDTGSFRVSPSVEIVD